MLQTTLKYIILQLWTKIQAWLDSMSLIQDQMD